MAEKQEEPRMAYATLKDGTDMDISVSAIYERMAKHVKGRQAVNVINATAMGGGLIRLDVDLDELTADRDFHFEEGTQIPTPRMPKSSMRADVPYYFLLPADEDGIADAELWTCDPTAIATETPEAWTFEEVDLTIPDPETGERRTVTKHTLGDLELDPAKLIAPYNKDEESYLTFGDVILGVYILDASVDVATQMRDAKAPKPSTLPRQDTITPRRQYDPDTKAANLMTEAAMFDSDGVLLDVAGAKERRDVNVAVSFSVDEGVELSREISAYDREVHRAISSRWVAGNRNITAAQIANDMGIPNPTPNQIRKVVESIELQRRVFGHIDFSEEARGRRLSFPDGTPVDECVVDGHLLEMQGITMRAANGHEVRGYQLDSAPLLYRHAAAIGQVVSYPQRWLEFGEGSATDKNMLLRSQLLRQVSRIKNPNWKKSNNIRFTTDPKHPDRPCLFSRVGINQKDRHARKNATDYVISVLDDLKKDGAIKGYTLNQQTARGGTKSTYGVTIKP